MTLTDAQLRDEMETGLKPAQIAAKYGISRQAVCQRVKKIQLTTTALATVAPVESRQYVAHQLDAMEELVASLSRVKLLMDACDAWLRDAQDRSRYDIGARSSEVVVTYWDVDYNGDEPRPKKCKASLAELLARVDGSDVKARKADRKYFDVDRAETKISDPRELILKTAQEVRQTIGAAADLARMLADARAMEALRESILTEIAKVSPDVAERIAQAVRRILVLHAASSGPDALPAG